MEKAARKRIFRHGHFCFYKIFFKTKLILILSLKNAVNLSLTSIRNRPKKAQQGKVSGEKKSTVRLTYEKKFENFKCYVESLPHEVSNRELAEACGLNLKTVYAYQRRLKDPNLQGISAYKAATKTSVHLPMDMHQAEN